MPGRHDWLHVAECASADDLREQILTDRGHWQAGPCHDVDHDTGTHQLRVLGRTTLEQARTSGPGRHFEVVLSRRDRP